MVTGVPCSSDFLRPAQFVCRLNPSCADVDLDRSPPLDWPMVEHERRGNLRNHFGTRWDRHLEGVWLFSASNLRLMSLNCRFTSETSSASCT